MTDPNTVSRTHRKGAQGFQRCMGSLAALTIFMGPAATMVSAQTLTYPNKPITLGGLRKTSKIASFSGPQ